jgi:hypothetical protein
MKFLKWGITGYLSASFKISDFGKGVMRGWGALLHDTVDLLHSRRHIHISIF